jgi:hypothetical protein
VQLPASNNTTPGHLFSGQLQSKRVELQHQMMAVRQTMAVRIRVGWPKRSTTSYTGRLAHKTAHSAASCNRSQRRRASVLFSEGRANMDRLLGLCEAAHREGLHSSCERFKDAAAAPTEHVHTVTDVHVSCGVRLQLPAVCHVACVIIIPALT